MAKVLVINQFALGEMVIFKPHYDDDSWTKNLEFSAPFKIRTFVEAGSNVQHAQIFLPADTAKINNIATSVYPFGSDIPANGWIDIPEDAHGVRKGTIKCFVCVGISADPKVAVGFEAPASIDGVAVHVIYTIPVAIIMEGANHSLAYTQIELGQRLHQLPDGISITANSPEPTQNHPNRATQSLQIAGWARAENDSDKNLAKSLLDGDGDCLVVAMNDVGEPEYRPMGKINFSGADGSGVGVKRSAAQKATHGHVVNGNDDNLDIEWSNINLEITHGMTIKGTDGTSVILGNDDTPEAIAAAANNVLEFASAADSNVEVKVSKDPNTKHVKVTIGVYYK